MTGHETLALTQSELQDILTKAAHDGARQALADVGLGDEDAVEDFKEFRALMKTYRFAKKVVAQSILKALARRAIDFLLIAALIIGAGSVFTIKS